MPTKNDCLSNLAKIQKEHDSYVTSLDILLKSDETITNKQQDVTNCSFSQWVRDNEFVRQYLGLQLFDKMVGLHEEWHIHYNKVAAVLFEEKKGFFGKLLSKDESRLKKDRARAYFDDLTKTAEEFNKTIGICQRRIKALSEAKFS